MELWLVLIVLAAFAVGGVWGSIILSGLFNKWRQLPTPTDDARIDQLEEDHHGLEAQVERLEEEIRFFRELQQPEIPTQLPSPDREGSGG